MKTEIDSLKELIRDLRGDVGEIMSMHDGQEEDLNSRLDRHQFNINQLREDHNSLKEEYQELEAENAVLRIRLNHMQDRLCHCADRRNPPISAVGSPALPAVPASPEYSPEFHTPSIEVQSLGSVSSAPSTPVNYYYRRGARRVSEGSRSEGRGTFRLCCEGEE